MNSAAAFSIPVQVSRFAWAVDRHNARVVAICAVPLQEYGGRRKAFKVRY